MSRDTRTVGATGHATRVKFIKGEGARAVRDTVLMEITIDYEALANYFAKKLARSKGGTSKIQNGAIKARRVSMVETPL